MATLKAIMEEIETLDREYMNVSYRDQNLCLTDIVYAVAAASKNLTAFDVVNICKDVMKDYKQPAEEEE